MINKWRKIWGILGPSFDGFIDDKILKLSASLAFYTIFAMGPLLFMVILLCGFIYGKDAVQGRLLSELTGFIGKETAEQVQYIIKNAALMGRGIMAAIVGGVLLLISATSIFAEIQDSLNMIWSVKSKPKNSFFKYL
jgi:membrane protein